MNAPCTSNALAHSLKDSNASPKIEITKEEGIKVRSLIHNNLGVERHVGTSGWGLGQVTNGSIIHIHLHKPNNKLVNVWFEHLWYIDEP
jgi:hypothetical protein